MNERLSLLSEGTDVAHMLTQVDTSRLMQELGVDHRDDTVTKKVARLRVAATIALGQLFGEQRIDDYIRRSAQHEMVPAALGAFRKWSGLLSAMADADQSASVEELLCFAATGLMARRATEVRSGLHMPDTRNAIAAELAGVDEMTWAKRVRTSVSLALLLLVVQNDHADVAMASTILNRLSEDQRRFETEWLERSADDSRDALVLLGLYHLAQAVARTSEYLLVGSARRNDRGPRNFAPELARLLVRAEEYLLLSNHSELKLWLNAVAAILWQVRASSIWGIAGISERLDQLMVALAEEGRKQPVFSLLPSQEDALRKNLLDPNRIAVILQMPTSAGKTLLAEFAIVQAFQAYKTGVKVVYIAPTRALTSQVRRTLTEDLRPLGIEVSAAGSAFEDDPYELQMLSGTDGVVIATPEKLDLMLRAHPEWFDGLRLLVVDEAHLLRDSERGVRLELLLANLRREQPKARLLLMTPFMENSDQVAAWLGDERGIAIDVNWRPSRILLGLVEVSGRVPNRVLKLHWREPYDPERCPSDINMPTEVKAADMQGSLDRVLFLAKRFANVGTILGMFAGSRVAAEKAAHHIAETRTPLREEKRSPALRVAIALAQNDYGANSTLAFCLDRGVAFHHSALSSVLRFLIEDLVRNKTVDFIAATSTLAQGMNFPVAAVIVHSVMKPRNRGALTSSEFWNIAGRAGRVGLVDRGLVIFADTDDRESFERYSRALIEPLRSALLEALRRADSSAPLKTIYRDYPEIRPFIQFLAHAAATASPANAMANLEELLQSSLAMRQVRPGQEAAGMRSIARAYLTSIRQKERGYLKVADQTGLGSFSFDELYARIGDDPLLRRGPNEIIRRKSEGIRQLVEALKWLPELSLAIGMGAGQMSAAAVAAVVQGWIDGSPIHVLSGRFPGRDTEAKVRNAGTYVHSKVSQVISWGTHAYLRGWLMRSGSELPPEDKMLPAYIQYGVSTPEAAIAALLNVPRAVAEPVAAEYRALHGSIKPEDSLKLKEFVESGDVAMWSRAVERSPFAGSLDASDVRIVWRQMQGLAPAG